jgi:hypothetical protein
MMYLVLGMHKSGTSLIAELLHKAGISMVDEAQQGSYEDGAYYERQSSYHLNMALLGWTDEKLLYRKGEAKATAKQIAQMQAIITENQNRHANWGFKDPRTCLTYPLWAKVLPPHRLIVVFRPVEDSWHRYQYKGLRFWKHFQRAFQLVEAWLAYNQAILKIIEQTSAETLVLSYNKLISEESEFQRLSTFIGSSLIDLREKKSLAPKNDLALAWAKASFAPTYRSVLARLESL